MRHKYIFYIITLLALHNSEGFFKSHLKKLKSKAKEWYKDKTGKNKPWQFSDDTTEYPGTNQKYIDLHTQRWQEYYNCLNHQKHIIGEKGSVIPEAVYGFQGESVRFECKICLSPREEEDIESVEWEFAGLDDQFLSPIEYTDNIFLSPKTKTLQLFNLQPDHTGQYKCKLGDTLTAPYLLTVGNVSEELNEVHSPNSARGPYPTPTEEIPDHNLIVQILWGSWSQCSRCGKAGKRHKLGYCLVDMIESNETERQEFLKHEREAGVDLEEAFISKTTELSPTETLITTTESFHKIKSTKEITENELELLHLFEFGLPCRSYILPESIKNLPAIKKRKNEIMIGYCKKSCEESSVFLLKDKNGNVIEEANNTAGIYSMSQGLPAIEPSVERILQYEKKGSDIILGCPGNLNTDTPIQWQIASKTLIPEVIYAESNGRIYISLTDKIHIKKAKVQDSNTYSCWQNNELAGTVRLVVEKKIKLNFNHHIMLLGIVIILSTFLFVFIKAFLGRKYAKT